MMAKDLKFRILEVEGLYYLCSENKGGYREAELRLCFCISKSPLFSIRGSYDIVSMIRNVSILNFNTLASP